LSFANSYNLKLELYIFIYTDVLETVIMIHDAKKIFQGI
jgi:hypothetical protein